MRRRDFITLVGGAAVGWPLAVPAQQTALVKRRIGAMIIRSESDPLARKERAVFEQILEKLGWILGRNLEIDYRWGIAELGTAQNAVLDLLALMPDLIVANSVVATRAAKEATHDIPIVFNAVSEPISLGFVVSLSRPGGNITGFTNLEPSIGGKWLELLKALAPQVSQTGIMFNPASTAIAPQFVAATAAAAPKFDLAIAEASVHEPADIDAVIERLGKELRGSLITLPDTFLSLHFKRIVDAAARWRLPSIHPFRYFVEAGSLMSYGPDLVDQFRQTASYVDRILRGEKVAELPVQQPTKFEFIINRRTAKTLGLIVPQSLLVAADEVID